MDNRLFVVILIAVGMVGLLFFIAALKNILNNPDYINKRIEKIVKKVVKAKIKKIIQPKLAKEIVQYSKSVEELPQSDKPKELKPEDSVKYVPNISVSSLDKVPDTEDIKDTEDFVDFDLTIYKKRISSHVLKRRKIAEEHIREMRRLGCNDLPANFAYLEGDPEFKNVRITEWLNEE